MSGDEFTKDMSGDFRGDFSRDTFDPAKQFSRVLMQQGRVQLDADWNEQVSIILHYMRQLGADLMGPHGAPYPDDTPTERTVADLKKNFKINPVRGELDFYIEPGCYYVNGIRCDNDGIVQYSNQPNYPFTDEEVNKLFDKETATGSLTNYLVYLDVWERHLTYVEDDYMRETALGGADTATRAKVVWQVKVTENSSVVKETPYSEFLKVLPFTREDHQKPKLKARAKKPSGDDNKPCLTAPEASYRGVENQLYRVEIHNEGTVTGGINIVAKYATFKWSRENGSVIFPITNISDGKITLEHLGRDDRFGLQPGDWVEVLDDDVVLRNEANPLLKVKEVDRENLQVTLTMNKVIVTLFDKIATDIKKNKTDKHPYLRRWDQKKNVNEDGVIPLTEGYGENSWISLEDGIEIQFDHQLEVKLRPKDVLALTGEETPVARLPQTTAAVVVYQTGDYWLIPARTATGDVEWPGPVGNPDAVLPHGVQHHYAPLAIITVENGKIKEDEKDSEGKITKKNPTDLRRHLKQGWV